MRLLPAHQCLLLLHLCLVPSRDHSNTAPETDSDYIEDDTSSTGSGRGSKTAGQGLQDPRHHVLRELVQVLQPQV